VAFLLSFLVLLITPRLQKKQDKCLFVGFYILINLAEDVTVERKMIKKGLIDYLGELVIRLALLLHSFNQASINLSVDPTLPRITLPHLWR